MTTYQLPPRPTWATTTKLDEDLITHRAEIGEVKMTAGAGADTEVLGVSVYREDEVDLETGTVTPGTVRAYLSLEDNGTTDVAAIREYAGLLFKAADLLERATEGAALS